MNDQPPTGSGPMTHPPRGRLHLDVWPCLLVGGGVLALLAWWLRAVVCPWELVLTIPGGYDESEYAGVSRGGPPLVHMADVSADERLLALARPDNTVDIWDLQTHERRLTVASPRPIEHESRPAMDGGLHVRLFNDGRRLLYDYDHDWRVHDLETDRNVFEHDPGIYYALVAPSPDGRSLAAMSVDVVHVYRLGEPEPVMQYRRHRINHGNARLEWSADGASLLINDHLSVRVIDASTGEERFAHRELDLRLPPPMIADDSSGLAAVERERRAARERDPDATPAGLIPDDSGRASIAMLFDSRFSSDGTVVISAYQSDDFFGSGDPEAHRLRFYSAATGRLLADHVIGRSIRRMRTSPDGSRMYVLTVEGFEHRLYIFDVAQRMLVDTIDYKLAHHFPAGFTPFADNRTIASYSDQLWVIDTQRRLAPVQIMGSPNAEQVIVNVAGDRLIEIGMDKTARVWRLRRPMSRFGAYALPVTWLIEAASIAMVLAMVIFAGVRTRRQIGRAIPKALWVAGVLGGLTIATSIAGDVIDYGAGLTYTEDRDVDFSTKHLVVTWCGHLLFLYAVVGLMRIRKGWRGLLIVVNWIGAILIGLVIGAVVFIVSAEELRPMLEQVQLQGWRWDLSRSGLIAMMSFALVLTLIELACLHARSTRELFKHGGGVAGPGRGERDPAKSGVN